MKFSIEKINKLMAGVIVVQLLAISAMAQAEEVGVAGVSDTAIAVDVIVNIDKDNRVTSWFGKNHNTPDLQISKIGPFDQWPTGLGFDYFYGFMGGDNSQRQPANLARNTTYIYPV